MEVNTFGAATKTPSSMFIDLSGRGGATSGLQVAFGNVRTGAATIGVESPEFVFKSVSRRAIEGQQKGIPLSLETAETRIQKVMSKKGRVPRMTRRSKKDERVR